MYRPTIYRNRLFDDLFGFPFTSNVPAAFEKHESRGLMKTDIYEKDKNYVLAVELPGFDKNRIEISLDKGELTVFAGCNQEKENEDTEYIRRERFTGAVSRTFYVGEDLKVSDIHAHFENGVLYLEFPKEVEKETEQKKLIAID